LMFEADFKGAGGGTGGDSDIVTRGGTGALVTSTYVSGTVTSANSAVAGGAS